MLLIYEQEPGTIIEIGSHRGGAANFYRDLTRTYGLDTGIVTVDIEMLGSNLERDDGIIDFIQADATRLEESRLEARLPELPRPWLVIEDSAHTAHVCFRVLEYFADRMQAGEYLIMEDGIVEAMGIKEAFGGGPNEAIRRFFEERPDAFTLDTRYTDFFGRNATYNPNGFLKKL